MKEDKEELTDAQHRVFEFVENYICQKEYSPALRDIMQGLGLTSTNTIWTHLNALERKGYIKRDRFVSRSIRLT